MQSEQIGIFFYQITQISTLFFRFTNIFLTGIDKDTSSFSSNQYLMGAVLHEHEIILSPCVIM